MVWSRVVVVVSGSGAVCMVVEEMSVLCVLLVANEITLVAFSRV